MPFLRVFVRAFMRPSMYASVLLASIVLAGCQSMNKLGEGLGNMGDKALETIGFKNGFSGSVERISCRCGRFGRAPPTRVATFGDQAPAAQTMRPAVTVPFGVTMTDGMRNVW